MATRSDEVVRRTSTHAGRGLRCAAAVVSLRLFEAHAVVVDAVTPQLDAVINNDLLRLDLLDHLGRAGSFTAFTHLLPRRGLVPGFQRSSTSYSPVCAIPTWSASSAPSSQELEVGGQLNNFSERSRGGDQPRQYTMPGVSADIWCLDSPARAEVRPGPARPSRTCAKSSGHHAGPAPDVDHFHSHRLGSALRRFGAWWAHRLDARDDGSGIRRIRVGERR